MELQANYYFSVFGTVVAAYLTFKFVTSLWSGIKLYILAPRLGLGVDFRQLGEWAVVTGATDGIGKGYAFELARRGMKIVLVSRSPEKLQDVAQEIAQKYNVQTKTIAVDFTKVPGIFEKVRTELSGMDIGVLVNNVGMSHPNPTFYIEIQDDSLVQNIVDVNVHSVTMMTRIVLPSMYEKKRGAIINIASGSAILPTPLLTTYAATKSFVDFFSRGLAAECRSKGIIVQAVLPFFVATKLSKIRRASLFVASPTAYARSALATVGLQDRTFGFWSHALQAYAMSLLPEFVSQMATNITLSGARKAAIKKAERRAREEKSQ